jgi:hypothetical protein
LKSPDLEKEMKANESKFAFIYLLLFGFAWVDLAGGRPVLASSAATPHPRA